jgi:hypothetical protein
MLCRLIYLPIFNNIGNIVSDSRLNDRYDLSVETKLAILVLKVEQCSAQALPYSFQLHWYQLPVRNIIFLFTRLKSVAQRTILGDTRGRIGSTKSLRGFSRSNLTCILRVILAIVAPQLSAFSAFENNEMI